MPRSSRPTGPPSSHGLDAIFVAVGVGRGTDTRTLERVPLVQRSVPTEANERSMDAGPFRGKVTRLSLGIKVAPVPSLAVRAIPAMVATPGRMDGDVVVAASVGMREAAGRGSRHFQIDVDGITHWFLPSLPPD